MQSWLLLLGGSRTLSAKVRRAWFFSWDRLFHSCRIAKSYSSLLPYREHFSVHFQVKALPLFMHSEAVPKKTPLCCSSDHPWGHREDSSWSGWDSQHSSQWDSCWTKCSWQHSPCHSCTWTWTRIPQGSHRDRRWVRWVSLPLCDLSLEHGEGEGSTLCLLFQGTLNGKTSLPWAVPPAAWQQCCPGTILHTFWCGSSLHSLPNLLWTSLANFSHLII